MKGIRWRDSFGALRGRVIEALAEHDHAQHRDEEEEADDLANMLSMASLIEKQLYPVNAKYHLMLEGVLDNVASRSQNVRQLTATRQLEVEQLRRLTNKLMRAYEPSFGGTCRI